MTAQEMKEMALQAAKKEYDAVVAELKKAAGQGKFTVSFKELSDGLQELLKEDGYNVYYSDPLGLGGTYRVSVAQ